MRQGIVLIGRNSVGPGVVGILHPWGRRTDASKKPTHVSGTIRQKILNDWALIPQCLVPKNPPEMIFKISRHFGENNEVWSWLGYYRHALFSENRRGGAYIGAGFVYSGEGYFSKNSVQLVINVAEDLLQQTTTQSEVTRSVHSYELHEGFASNFGIVTYEDVVNGGGLCPAAQNKLFIDMNSDLKERACQRDILDLVNRSQKEQDFSRYSEMILGLKKRQAEEAAASHDYDVVAASEWEYSLRQKNEEFQRRNGKASDFLVDERPQTGQVLLDKDEIAVETRADNVIGEFEILRRDIHRLEKSINEKFLAIEKIMLDVNEYSEAAGGRSKIAPLQMLVYASIGAMLAFMVTGLFRVLAGMFRI